jgi:hypothetical protein
LDPYFFQGCAKVAEKRFEVRFSHTHLSCFVVSGVDIFAGVNDLSPEEHGDKHALPCAEVIQANASKKRPEAFIRQNPFIKGFNGSVDFDSATNHLK